MLFQWRAVSSRRNGLTMPRRWIGFPRARARTPHDATIIPGLPAALHVVASLLGCGSPNDEMQASGGGSDIAVGGWAIRDHASFIPIIISVWKFARPLLVFPSQTGAWSCSWRTRPFLRNANSGPAGRAPPLGHRQNSIRSLRNYALAS